MLKRAIPILAVLALTLNFSSCSCIYFNTFHNIRKNFNAAEETRKKDNREKANPTENKQYNDAITKASKVLERHPNSSWVDDALYIIGSSYYRLGEFDKSARKFKELFANYPQSEYISPARLLYAKDKLKLEEDAEGVVLFEEILRQERNKDMRAEAARSLGQYYFDEKEYEKAIVYFQSLLDSLGQDRDKLNALSYMADGYFDLYQFDKAYANYEEALKVNPDTLQTYWFTFRMAQCDYFMNRFQDGLAKLGELAGNDVYFDSLASVRLMMARGYEWDGELDDAISTYEKVIEENPKKDAAAIAHYELGLIYQYDLEDLDKALVHYAKARDEKSKSPVYTDATKRASTLTLLQQYSQADTLIVRPGTAKPAPPGKAADSTGSVFDTTGVGPVDGGDAETTGEPVDTIEVTIPYAYEPPETTETEAAVPEGKIDTIQVTIPYAYVPAETEEPAAASPMEPEPSAGPATREEVDTIHVVIPYAPPEPSDPNRADTIQVAVPLEPVDTLWVVTPYAPPESSAEASLREANNLETAVPMMDATHIMGVAPDAMGPAALKAGSAGQEAGADRKPKPKSNTKGSAAADSALAAMQAAQTLQEQIDQAGLNLYHLGELFYVELEKPDSALHAFATLLERYPDARSAPRALIAMAQIQRNDFADTAGADSLLRRVLRDYAGYDEVKEVVGLLGLAGTVADSGYAAIVYNRAESFLEQFKAVDSTPYYLRLEADSGIGLVRERKGSDYVRDLRLLDSAQAYYRRVAEGFPHSDYSIQARYALLKLFEMYLAPDDSANIERYEAFTDSFPNTPYSSSISAQLAAFKAPLKKSTPIKDEEPEADSTALAAADSTILDSMGSAIDTTGISRFISDEKGNQLPPAQEYFLREEVPFKYPLEAVAYHIEDKLYFHIRIDFSGEVVEVKLVNETQSRELNENVIKTVENTKFDIGKMPSALFDHWFYYTYTVTMPPEYRQ
ncbi:MAG: tetratricopeptide repeat protein [candidate division Zixibacteria bacterium]|nr:tetratricopeptide repeat protein [candidate division Zixibacteria bacterium]